MRIILNSKNDEKLLSTLKAVAEPSRLKILKILNDGEFSVRELADKTGLTSSNISAQIKKLEDVNLIDVKYVAGNHGTKKISRIRVEEIRVRFGEE